MTEQADTTSTSPAPTAADLVAALEALPIGEPWADQKAAAETAVLDLIERAVARLFLSVPPIVTADLFATLQFLMQGFGAGAARIERTRALHARLVRSGQYVLTDMIRSQPVIDTIGDAAVRFVEPSARVAARADAIARFHVDLARHLVGSGHELAEVARDLVHGADLSACIVRETARREADAAMRLAEEQERQQAVQRAIAELADRAAAEAKAEAQRLEHETLIASRTARQLRGERLAAKLRGIGRETINVGGCLYGAEDVAALAATDQFSDGRLAMFEDALATPKNHAPTARDRAGRRNEG